MKPIEGWDLINEAGEYKRLPAGIYKLKIIEVIDVVEKSYFEVRFEIADGEYKGYFGTTSKLGYGSTTKSYKQNALPYFKAFITAIEKTNPGYQWNWDEKTLANKCVVGVFGEEEYLRQDNTVGVSTKLQEFRSAQALKDGSIVVPPLKKLERVVQDEPAQCLQKPTDTTIPW